LGRDCAYSAWQAVYQDYDDLILCHILNTGWEDVHRDDEVEIEGKIAKLLERFFSTDIEGVDMSHARQLVEKMPPIHQIKQTFRSLNVRKEITAFDALHLRFDGVAFLVEALIHSYGKQGELITYDLLREERIKAGGGKTGSVAEFIANFVAEPEEASLFTAGLGYEIVRSSEVEVALQIKECEWARYFQERHPQVGYLIACSTDEAAYKEFNENLRMQRTMTIMEGGKVCDFRIYTASEAITSS
jgi:hypothetical protein